MNSKNFDAVLERRIELTRKVLTSKKEEYASDGDRLHNFKRAAAILEVPREKALAGMWSKHLVSLIDIINNVGKGKLPTEALLEEKIGDSINYMILLEAMIKEDIAKVAEDD